MDVLLVTVPVFGKLGQQPVGRTARFRRYWLKMFRPLRPERRGQTAQANTVSRARNGSPGVGKWRLVHSLRSTGEGNCHDCPQETRSSTAFDLDDRLWLQWLLIGSACQKHGKSVSRDGYGEDNGTRGFHTLRFPHDASTGVRP